MSVRDYHSAIRNGEIDTVRTILNLHPEWIDAIEDDISGLHLAAFHGEVEILAFLLEVGSEMMNRPLLGRYPIDFASAGNQIAAAAFLIQRGCTLIHDFSPLHIAACCANLEMVQFLTSCISPITLDVHNRVPLYYAYVLGDPKVIEFLLSITDISKLSTIAQRQLNFMFLDVSFGHGVSLSNIFHVKPIFISDCGIGYGRVIKYKLGFGKHQNVERIISREWWNRNVLVLEATGHLISTSKLDSEEIRELRSAVYFESSLTSRLLISIF